MIGAGEAYLSALGVFLGGSSFQIACLAAIPPLLGATAQILGARLQGFGRRRVIVVFAALQAITWFFIASLPAVDGGVWALVLLATFYHAFGNAGAPAWNSLIGDLVPESIRGQYFGFRNKRSGLGTLIAMFCAGVFLHYAPDQVGFSSICIFAGVSRLVSAYYLSKYEDLPFQSKESDYFSFFDFIKRAPNSNFAKFVFFFGIMNGAVVVGGPFIPLYLLNDLKVSYLSYMFLIGGQLVTQVLTMQHWGVLTDKFGNKKILNISAIGLSIIPFMWLVDSSFYYLLSVQVYAGFVWAGFNLAASNFIFDAVSPAKRGRCAAYTALVNAIFVFGGAMLGSLVVSLSEGINGSVYMIALGVSGVLRLTTAFVFLPKFKEVREVESISHKDLLFRLTAVRPFSGGFFSIFSARRH